MIYCDIHHLNPSPQYTVLFDSASDVCSLGTPNDGTTDCNSHVTCFDPRICSVRRALLDAPENVATLIKVIASRLFTLTSDHTFPSPPNASVTAFASSFIKTGTGATERNTTKEVLNCLRVLQRVLPVVFEVDGESSTFELEVLWKKPEVEDDRVEVEDAAPQFVIEDDDDDGEAVEQKAGLSQGANPQKEKKKLPSLAERLFSCLIDLLFCCGFTLPAKIQVDHYKINYVIW